MDKLKSIIGVIVSITVVLLLSLILVPDILVPMANTANATMASTSNMTNYPGTAEAVTSAPWVLFLAIPVVGIAGVVLVLRPPIVQEVMQRIFRR